MIFLNKSKNRTKEGHMLLHNTPHHRLLLGIAFVADLGTGTFFDNSNKTEIIRVTVKSVTPSFHYFLYALSFPSFNIYCPTYVGQS